MIDLNDLDKASVFLLFSVLTQMFIMIPVRRDTSMGWNL